MRKRAIDKAVAFVTERLNGEDGLGAIFPAMANSRDDVRRARLSGGPSAIARSRARRSTSCWSSRSDEAYCQPCVSPVWDTALVCHALLEVGGERGGRAGRARARLARSRCRCSTCRRLDRAAAGRAARRLGVPVRQRRIIPISTTPRSSSWRWTARRALHAARGLRRRRSRARANGSSACRARTAAGARSTPTTTTTISTTSRSPTTARCSIRRPRTSPRAACRCWRSSARRPATSAAVARARRLSARARSCRTAAGTAAGA